nr:acyltransferase [Cryptococcus depauperatus CBS 7841]
MTQKPLYTIPIVDRHDRGPWTSRIFFPIFFTLGHIGGISAQFMSVPLLLIPLIGRRLFDNVIGWTKDGYARLLVAITVLFAPTKLAITSNSHPDLKELVQYNDAGDIIKINLPDRLVVIANHQAYLDWIYIWILCAYAGHSRGLIILLKSSLKHIPVIGWGMRFFNFIFLKRSWAADKDNLALALTQLGRKCRTDTGNLEISNRLPSKKRPPLWLLIFPEGTIVSDEERIKSIRYAEREGIDDYVTSLHPRSTGLLFCLRTLLQEIPDLQLLDLTIGYPGVPYGKYPQDWYGLSSVFLRSVPPPTVHIHLHLHSLSAPDLKIPSLGTTADTSDNTGLSSSTGLATPQEARAFELWLRGLWDAKEKRMSSFYKEQQFADHKSIIPIKQLYV